MSASYEKRQEKWIEKHDVEVSDFVTVMHKYDSKTCGIWTDWYYWDPEMDKFVGKVCRVVKICKDAIKLSLEGCSVSYYFPYSVLRKEKEVKKFYIERQEEWADKNQIEVGSTVRVIRRAKQGEDGWRAVWAEGMDAIVGEAGVVKGFVGDAGVRVRFNEKFSWSLPYFVLEKVESKEKEMKKSYVDRQAEWVKKNDIKIGDKVRLIRKAESGEDGWPNVWPGKVDEWAGKILKVKEISGGNISCYNFEENDWFNFPYFVLEKVIERKDKEWTVSYGLKVKTGDPVLMRDDELRPWRYSVFSHKHSGEDVPYPYYSAGILAAFCIPYVGNEHLVGTTDDYKAPEETTKPKFVFGAKVKATLSCGDEMEGVLIGIDTEDHDTPFEVAVRDKDAELGRIRYWAESVTYID